MKWQRGEEMKWKNEVKWELEKKKCRDYLAHRVVECGREKVFELRCGREEGGWECG